MADDLPPIMAGIAREMKYLAARQRVIAQNVANSETPGYKARELSQPDFGDLLAGSAGGARVARPHVDLTPTMNALGAHVPAGADQSRPDRDVTEIKPDGNNVTLEDQLMKMGTLQADFTAMTNLYRRQQALMKTALGRGGG